MMIIKVQELFAANPMDLEASIKKYIEEYSVKGSDVYDVDVRPLTDSLGQCSNYTVIFKIIDRSGEQKTIVG